MRTRLVALAIALVFSSLAPAVHAAAPGDAHPPTDRVARCSWARPGADPYRGTAAEALARYTDMPAEVRTRLLQRMARHEFDDVVAIRRDAIEGRALYDPRITDMHFGRRTLCHAVSREGWREGMEERALVYCEDKHCVMTPTVCRNVSRIVRVPRVIDLPEPLELAFDPPGAIPSGEHAPVLPDPPLDGGGAPPAGGDGRVVVGIVPLLPGTGGGWRPGVPPAPAVPEPPSASLLLVGVAALALLRLRRILMAS